MVSGVGKHLGGLGQPGADAVPQLLGGGVGKGDHQQVRRQQVLQWAVFCLAMAQHQAHIQDGDGEGFAGACAGLDQRAAVQGQGQWVQIRVSVGSLFRHSMLPICSAADLPCSASHRGT